MRPRWYFTNPQLNRYLTGMIKRWDVENIGALGEAFSIAGCDLMGMYALRCLSIHVLPRERPSVLAKCQVACRLGQE